MTVEDLLIKHFSLYVPDRETLTDEEFDRAYEDFIDVLFDINRVLDDGATDLIIERLDSVAHNERKD